LAIGDPHIRLWRAKKSQCNGSLFSDRQLPSVSRFRMNSYQSACGWAGWIHFVATKVPAAVAARIARSFAV
jgi:hypothetical protein